MSDTWEDIQALKNKQSSLRAKLLQRKREREGLVAEITKASPTSTPLNVSGSGSTAEPTIATGTPVTTSGPGSRSSSPAPPTVTTPKPPAQEPVRNEAEVEKKVLLVLCDITLDIPCNASVIADHASRMLGHTVNLGAVEDLLQKFAAQSLLSLVSRRSKDQSRLTVNTVDISKLSAVSTEPLVERSKKRKRELDEDEDNEEPASKQVKQQPDDSIESLLSMQSAKEKESKKMTDEILQLLTKPTAKEQLLVERFKSQGGVQLKEFCQYGTKEECARTKEGPEPCTRLHFRKIIHKHTDESLGDCSFLNTCFHMDTCKYVHYEIAYPEVKETIRKKDMDLSSRMAEGDGQLNMYSAQWIQCDLRFFDMSTLGKCAVVMADPPWDIHMELPYGTMSDDEMRRLDVPGLQDEGYIFLWVTGRAMELGRECLELWGYKRCDEIIWVKTNQLQRIIRTGRTGHWLNHGKEHCLVGVKGDLKGVNKGLDCDVIVAEVRATSHKPDEIYGIIERLSPGTRKVELFGRPHNVQPNWITLGNQVEGVRLKDPDVVQRFRAKYPDGNCLTPPTKKF